VVHPKGVEPSSHCWHKNLNLACLPIPPRVHEVKEEGNESDVNGLTSNARSQQNFHGGVNGSMGCVRKVTNKSGIAYVMRIEREFDALLSLQLSRTPHHRRPFLISEACFHCHAPPCTPLCLFSEEWK
jgi:hypothetical protein